MGRCFLNTRQILNLDICGVTLAPEFLRHLQNPKMTHKAAGILHTLQEHELLIYANRVTENELLATPHKILLNWISGSVITGEIALNQLQWYSPEASLG